ncbi:FimV/HubP family polar landmark protein [Vibrio sonorensis]|uniref:FimV/HubP family polar landmark protein n=1 Tax=Vibrio sonorensis TaxID=1004316 RepID=UPI0008D94EE5|nr:FimV/HubP family polar landmark protein [Vibrio sonorensis]
MRRLLTRLLLPIALVAVTQTSIVSAETIRLKGPNGEIQSSPQYSDPSVRSFAPSNQPSQFYGPTTEQETLWSIASRLRPANSVTVQQTLLAIYQLNPQAFEQQNIHELIPGSALRIPSLVQVRSVTTAEAIRVMELHQARLDGIELNQPTVPIGPAVEQTPNKTEVVKPEADPQPAPKTANSDLKEIAQGEKKKQVTSLERQLESSESDLLALEEKNHKLRLMLADVQSEVDVLKDELGDESRIKSEVEKLLEEERARLAEEQKLAPSELDMLFSNTWLVAALAVIPGLLIGLILVLLLGSANQILHQ